MLTTFINRREWEYIAKMVVREAIDRMIKKLNGNTHKIIKNALDISTEVDQETIEKAINLFKKEN